MHNWVWDSTWTRNEGGFRNKGVSFQDVAEDEGHFILSYLKNECANDNEMAMGLVDLAVPVTRLVLSACPESGSPSCFY